ncbi:MAG: phosphoribosyl-AMP cyclohydrolase [Actinomycetales bacterium]|nr:phosphoribosyl-AMP cyclohydrolase [Actinomycetales bacterium]
MHCTRPSRACFESARPGRGREAAWDVADPALRLLPWTRNNGVVTRQSITFLQGVRFDGAGLVPAIAQQWDTREVLMLAWMNREALERTMATGQATYFSRSRQALWVKGETSGHRQQVRSVSLDCDGDTVLLMVDQIDGACHTGDRTCFDAICVDLGPS